MTSVQSAKQLYIGLHAIGHSCDVDTATEYLLPFEYPVVFTAVVWSGQGEELLLLPRVPNDAMTKIVIVKECASSNFNGG